MDWYRLQQQRSARQSSPVGSEGVLHLLLAACERAEKEKETETGELSEEENSELGENKTFTHTALSSEGSLSGDSSEEESSSDEKKGNWEDDPDSLPARRSSWLDTRNTPYANDPCKLIIKGQTGSSTNPAMALRSSLLGGRAGELRVTEIESNLPLLLRG